MTVSFLTTSIRTEHDVLLTRQRARQIAHLLGFDTHDQTRIATAVSEIARNTVQNTGGGKVEFVLVPGIRESLQIHVKDNRTCLPSSRPVGKDALSATLAETTMQGIRHLMDVVYIGADQGQNSFITLGKYRPVRCPPLSRKDLAFISSELIKQDRQDPLAEMQRQNQELLNILEELRIQQEERERTQKERDLLLDQVQRDQARLRQVLEQIPAGVLILEATDDNQIFVSREAEHIFQNLGTSSATFIEWLSGRCYHADGTPVVPSDFPLLRALRTRETIRAKLIEVEKDDGKRTILLFNAAPICGEDGAAIAAVAAFYDITEQQSYSREIESLNVRLERSIQETHHRVKNNLQVISALVELQLFGENNMVPRSVLGRIILHTQSMAAIHDLLTQETKTRSATHTVSIRAALAKLMPLLESTTGGRSLQWTSDDFRVPVREGISLALLISEIVSNSIKHGAGTIYVRLNATDREAHLVIEDEGIGFTAGFDQNADKTGLTLIQSAACHDLRGNVDFSNRTEGGATVLVTFPLPSLSAIAEV